MHNIYTWYLQLVQQWQHNPIANWCKVLRPVWPLMPKCWIGTTLKAPKLLPKKIKSYCSILFEFTLRGKEQRWRTYTTMNPIYIGWKKRLRRLRYDGSSQFCAGKTNPGCICKSSSPIVQLRSTTNGRMKETHCSLPRLSRHVWFSLCNPFPAGR